MNPHFLRGFAEAVLLAAALFAAWSIKAYASPCLPSAEAVWKAHPGVHVRADWHYIDNRKCWMAKGEWDGRHQSVRSVVPTPVVADRSSRASSRGVASVPPEPTTDGMASPAPPYYPTFSDRWEGEPRETPAAYQSLEQALRWAIPGRRVVARMMEARR